jgi:hypothetical protein
MSFDFTIVGAYIITPCLESAWKSSLLFALQDTPSQGKKKKERKKRNRFFRKQINHAKKEQMKEI